MNKRKTISIGMIGYKFMGKAHSNAYRQAPFFFKLNAHPILHTISGRREEDVKVAARELGWSAFQTDWRRLIEDDEIDLIDIASPNNTHAEMAIAALEAGKHVICEKPLALNLEEAIRMKEAADKAGKVNMIMHNYRFAPAVQYAKELITNGKLGKIRHIRATYLNESLIDPNREFRWRLNKAVSGSGALGDIGSHIIDLSRFLVGEFSQVTGMMETFIEERPLEGTSPSEKQMGIVDVDDMTAFLARFENGAVGVFETSRMASGNKNGNRFEINGEKGSIRWDLENMNNLQIYLNDDPAGLKGFRTINCTDAMHPYAKNYWPAGHIIGYEHTFINLVHDLLCGIADGANPKPNFEDGVKNQAVLEAVERSTKEGTWVKISDLLEKNSKKRRGLK
ncbi:Gfo/Idh/MocA family protein [Alkalihalobacillus sp. 1P02AB]|uniref:Gfo/Idh/MocA family protein n=1 Tax=Alkalihalobacillus sp. 1P02AB TaxID=3132260 RepID=UPI0039A4FBCC